MIDIHVHLAALPDGKNGCFISQAMLNGILFRSLLEKLKLPRNSPERANAIYVDTLLSHLRESRYVRQAVILGMDGVYDSSGVLDRQATHFLICNDYVLGLAKRFPDHFLAGASINPQRSDAVDELH